MSEEKINTGRQYNLDLLKALAIVAMIVCHTVIMLSEARPDYASEFLYWLADVPIGSYLGVAHAFMFCMGVGFVYSKHNSPKYLMVRGIKIYITAYVLNFFRGGMYVIIGIFIDPAYGELINYTMLLQDILQFAGLAMVLTALFKKIKLNCKTVLLIAVLMSVFSQFTALKFNGNTFENILVGSFIPAGGAGFESTFVLCSWYIFVAAGLCFGTLLQRVKDADEFYKRVLTVSSVIMIAYIAATVKYGCFFLSPENQYYYPSIFEAVGLMSIDLVLASIMHFALRKLPERKIADSRFLKICFKMSKNINKIYFIQWCIIGLLVSIFVYLLEMSVPYWVSYLSSIGVIAVSYLAADKIRLKL